MLAAWNNTCLGVENFSSTLARLFELLSSSQRVFKSQVSDRQRRQRGWRRREAKQQQERERSRPTKYYFFNTFLFVSLRYNCWTKLSTYFSLAGWKMIRARDIMRYFGARKNWNSYNRLVRIAATCGSHSADRTCHIMQIIIARAQKGNLRNLC